MAWVNTSPLVKKYTIEEFWALLEPPDYALGEFVNNWQHLHIARWNLEQFKYLVGVWLVDELSGLIELRVLSGERYESHVFDREDLLVSTVLPDLQFKVGDVFGD